MLKVAVINPHERHFDRMSRLFIMPRYGTLAVAAALKRAGYQVRVFSEFIRAGIDWDYVYDCDFICIALMTFCSFKGYRLAGEIKKKTAAPIIFGGAHPTVLPEECLAHCDYVVRGEGDETVVELLGALTRGRSLDDVAGISFRRGDGSIVHNPKRPFIENIDYPQDATLFHEYDRVGQGEYGRMPVVNLQVVQTSRGCPFNCKFCVAPEELGTRYRTKSSATVLQDIEAGMALTGSNVFIIVDNEFTVKRERTRELLQAVNDRYGNSLHFILFARTEIAREPQILEAMKKAGVKILFLGIESVNEETLKFYDKRQSLEQIRENVARIHACGIHTMGSTILGSDYDSKEKIADTADFFIENGFYHANFYALYEIPGKEKTLGLPQMFPDHRFIHHDWRFFNSAFVIHYPKYMKPSTLQRIIVANYRKFYSLKRRLNPDPLKGTAFGRTAFKLYMVEPELKVAERYIPFLEELEEGLYDRDERLLEDKLLQVGSRPPLPNNLPIKLDDL